MGNVPALALAEGSFASSQDVLHDLPDLLLEPGESDATKMRHRPLGCKAPTTAPKLGTITNRALNC